MDNITDPEHDAAVARELDIYHYLYALAGVTEAEIKAAVDCQGKPVKPDPAVYAHVAALFPREVFDTVRRARRYRLAQAFTLIALASKERA